MKYYPLGKDLGYNHIPISYQEALIFIWTQQHPNFQGLPWSISRNVLEGVSEFARVYMTQKDSSLSFARNTRRHFGITYYSENKRP